MNEKIDEREPVSMLFAAPPAKYRGIPFWSWNCKVTRELIDTQLPIFRQMGFGGVDIHPRTGLDTEYLGEEYLELVKYTVQRCKELGLACWLYDDDRFPSGSAAGIVTRNLKYRGRFLLLTEKRIGLPEGFYENRESFDLAVLNGEKPAGYYVTAYGLCLTRDGWLRSYRRLFGQKEIRQAYQNGERIRYAYVKLMEEEAWFEDQAYVDTMNPEAVAEFIRVTHEAYAREVGEEFGKTVPAIFTDEPRMGKHPQISGGLSAEDVTIPYTDYMAQQMMERYGVDPLDIVPEYIWEREDSSFSEARYQYREVCAECFVSAFLDQIGKWCREHQILMTGHVLSEETLGSQTFALGDCMRCYRSMDFPGIDILVDGREFATVKQAVSVARQNGKAGVVSELYGVTHWDCSFQTFRLQGDWQAALGITIRVPHLSHMSLGGEAKRDWPGSIFFHAPWHEEFSWLEDYFARLNTVLTRGKAVVEIGVIHPVESMWMLLGPEDQTGELRREMDEDFARMIQWLLFGTLDFDFLSESLLPSQCGTCGTEPSGRLRVGQMSYSAVLVPGMITIRSTTLDILENFRENGGRVIFMGRIPELVDGKASNRARLLAENCICIGKDRGELYHALKEDRRIEIRCADGKRSDNLICQIRQEEGYRWLFVSHVWPQKQHLSRKEIYTITLQGRWKVTRYDALTGQICREEAVGVEEDTTCITCGMYAQDSLLYRLEEQERMNKEFDHMSDCVPEEEESWNTVLWLSQAESFRRMEPNVVLLDYASWSLDGGRVQEREEILRLDNRIRSQLGFVKREGRMNQPYHLTEKGEHRVDLYYQVASRIRTEVWLALEEVEACRVWLNGKEADRTVTDFYVDPAIQVIRLPWLEEGENELHVEVSYHLKRNLENMFLLGNFNVRLEGIKPVVEVADGELSIGDITGQGMPFYTGNLEYEFCFCVKEDGEYRVQVPHFCAPLLSCCLDGQQKGRIAFAPFVCDLGRLQRGEHRLTIRLYGNRFNGFGTLHNANDDFVWYGPDSFRTEGDDWTGCYRLRPVGLMAAVEIQKKERTKK